MRLLSAFAVLVAVAIDPRAVAAAEPANLSDADLLAYAAKPFDKAAMMERKVIIGQRHGLRVIADFPCGDICPEDTIRIIHFDLAPGPACEAAGGVTVTRDTPYSIATIETPFCVPPALATTQ